MSATTEQPKKPFKVAPIASKGFGVGTNDHVSPPSTMNECPKTICAPFL